MDAVESSARTVLAACSEGDALHLAVRRRFPRRTPSNAIALRRKVVGQLLQAGLCALEMNGPPGVDLTDEFRSRPETLWALFVPAHADVVALHSLSGHPVTLATTCFADWTTALSTTTSAAAAPSTKTTVEASHECTIAWDLAGRVETA